MATRRLQPLGMNDFQVTLADLPDLYFTTSSPIEKNRARSNYNDGITKQDYPMTGNISYADITISKPHDPDMDRQFFDFEKNTYDEAVGITMTHKPVPKGRNPVAVNSYTTLGAKIITWRVAEADSSSSDPSMLEIVLAPFDTQMGTAQNNALNFQ